MKIKRFKDGDELASAFAEQLRIEVQRDHGDKGDAGEAFQNFGIMLSGGSTPLKAYADVAASPVTAAPGCHLFMSDERHVPPTSDENNFQNARPMLTALGLPTTQLIRVRTGLDTAEAAAADYAEQLDAFLRSGIISFGALGMGGDGHTASLFSADDFEAAEGKIAIPVKRPAHVDGEEGISLTPSVFARVERLVFLVGGAKKAAMVKTLMEDPQSIPAGRVASSCDGAELWADEAALADV